MKYFFALILLIIPTVLFAGKTVEYKTGDWLVVVSKDDFTDRVSCALGTKNIGPGKGGIILWTKHDVSGNHGILHVNGKIGGVGITYRVDKKPPVTFGYKYHFQTDKDYYFLENAEYNQLVNDFKAGNSVVYRVHSGNQFVDDWQERISLMGFTKAYNIAEKCAF